MEKIHTIPVESREEQFITLHPEIIEHLNVRPGDTIDMEVQGNSILLHRKMPVEIDLEQFSKEELIGMITIMHEQNQTFNTFVEDTLSAVIHKYDQQNS